MCPIPPRAVSVFLNAGAKGRNKHRPSMGALPLPIMLCDSWSFYSVPGGALSVGGASSASLAALHWFACSDHSNCQSLNDKALFIGCKARLMNWQHCVSVWHHLLMPQPTLYNSSPHTLLNSHKSQAIKSVCGSMTNKKRSGDDDKGDSYKNQVLNTSKVFRNIICLYSWCGEKIDFFLFSKQRTQNVQSL